MFIVLVLRRCTAEHTEAGTSRRLVEPDFSTPVVDAHGMPDESVRIFGHRKARGVKDEGAVMDILPPSNARTKGREPVAIPQEFEGYLGWR